MVFLFPPLKPPSPQISVAKVLIVCSCHDKRLRVFLSLIQLFFTISIVVLIFVLFKMAVFFLFLRNVLLPIEILKIKILEHSDPPSQHFSVHKAFSHSFFCRGKVVLCHPAEWHTSSINLAHHIFFKGVASCTDGSRLVRTTVPCGSNLVGRFETAISSSSSVALSTTVPSSSEVYLSLSGS